jgi:pyruvate,water dikinase
VFLEEGDAVDAAVVGREAQQLHLLLENGVRVPQGFVVTAQAFADFMKASGAAEKVRHLLTASDVDAMGIGILTRQAQEAVLSSDLDWDIESEAVGGYEHLARADVDSSPKVSVVVSVAFHDGSFPYFANTFERRSEPHDRHDLDRALKQAWASLFTVESLQYFDSIGWDLGDIRSSVLVQRALSSEVAGVAVPTTGPGGVPRLIVKGVLGSAAALERALVEPETVVVDLDKGSAVERTSPRQDSFLYPDKSGRLRPLPLSPDLAGAPKVPDEACAELARLARLAHKVFGRPMVLEWAIEGDSVWVVNAIPVEAIEGGPGEGEQAAEEAAAKAAPAPPSAAPTKAEPGPPQFLPPVAPIEGLSKDEHDMVREALEKMGFAPKVRPVDAAAPAPPPPEPAPPIGEAPPKGESAPAEPPAEPVKEVAEPPSPPPEVRPAPAAAEAPAPVPATRGVAALGTEVLSPEQLDLGPYLPVTDMQVLLASTSVERVKELSGVPVTGVLFDDTEYVLRLCEGRHPSSVLEAEGDRFIETLAAGQVAMAVAVYPLPVFIRLSDLRSDVGRALKDGDRFEEAEAVPWMGFRGVGRLMSGAGQPLLRAEARAIRRARRDRSMTNVHLVIPFPRTVEEVEALYNVLFEEGVRRSGNLRMYIDVSVPATLLFLHLYSQVSDGFFVRLDELLPALLAVDPTSARTAERNYLTADDKAVRQALLLVTEAARQAKKEVIVESSKALDPRTLEFLMRIGITGVCLGLEGLRENVTLISKVEERLQGEERK